MQRPPRRPSDAGPPPAASFAAPPRGLSAFPHAVSSAAAAAAAVVASDFQRGVGVAELLGGPSAAVPAAPTPGTGAGEPNRVPQDMLSSAGSSTESSGYTESSSKTSLQSAESTDPRSRPTAISSLFFRGEREHLGSRPPPLRPAAPRSGSSRLAPLRPTPVTPRSYLDKAVVAKEKGLALRKPKKEARRAEIVAAVTKRLYTTKKKPDGSASEDTATPEPPPSVVEEDEEAEPEELKLCARARAKLQELSRRVIGPGAGRRLRPVLVDADVQTDIPRPTTRVKEKAVATDPYVQRVADAAVDTSDAPETRNVDVGVDTRQVPSDRVLCVRETAAGPDASALCTAQADAAIGAAAASVALPPRARPPPHPPPAKNLCSSACQSTVAEEKGTSDSKCFDCFLQSTSERIEDGPYVLGTKTKSNQCNLLDSLQECNEVPVGVIAHASTSCATAPDSQDGRMVDYKDAAVGTEKCFYHLQLQKYVGITAVPAPSILIHTQNNDSFTTNNFPTYFTSLGRVTQLPIRDRVTNNIYEYVNKSDSTGPLSYFNTYKPLISQGDAYTMRKSLGTQTLGNKTGNARLAWDTINRKHFGECSSNSYVPKKYKNFENQFSRTEKCCPISSSHVLYKQIDECFSDDSLDSSKSVDRFAEPDSIHDIQSCEHFSRHNPSFLVKKERNVRKSHFSGNNNCPVHYKSGYYPFNMKKGKHNTASKINETAHICHSSTHYIDSKSNAEPVYERCNLHKENWTCETQARNVHLSKDFKELQDKQQGSTLGKINNPYSVPLSNELNKVMEGTTPHTHFRNIQITRQLQDDSVMSELNSSVCVSENNQNILPSANDRSNTRLFALNETPFYTFTKCKTGYVAKEVTSFTLSPINYQLKETQFQSTQTLNKDMDDASGIDDNSKEGSTFNKPNEKEIPSKCSHTTPPLCSECNRKVSPITENTNRETESVSDNAQIDDGLVQMNKTIGHLSEISQNSLSDKNDRNGCSQLNDCHSSLCQDTPSSSYGTESPMCSVRKNINKKFSCDKIKNMLEEHNSNKNDLYSIIAYDQQLRENTNPNSLQKCINITKSQENSESVLENENTFHGDSPYIGVQKNNKKCSSSDILSTSLEQIKQCVQTIQSNLSKYYQTEIKTESMKNETPQEMTTKWVFSKSQQENCMSQEETSQCKFETVITLNKATNILPNWNGLFKISNNSEAVSSIEQNASVEPNSQDGANIMSTHTNKLSTSHVAENNSDDTGIKMEIKINDTQLKTGSITFGKNYTSFDTEVQNFKLLLILCGDLVDKSQNAPLQNQNNGQQKQFPENAVIKFTFEDGGFQPLLNIIVQQSMFHNSLRSSLRPNENATQHVNQDNTEDPLDYSKTEICKQNVEDNDRNSVVPQLLEGKAEKVINNFNDSHSFEETTPQTFQNQLQNVVENRKENNVDVINTQPTTQSHLTFFNHNHTQLDVKNKNMKQTTDGRTNSLNTSFFKKAMKKKKKCYPSAPSCMWNFMERQTLSNDTKLETSKTCSTISTFIKKANDLLTRLNEVTTMLDKGKRKQDTDPLISNEIFEHSDEDTFRGEQECDINPKCAVSGAKFSGEKPIATISKNYRIPLHEPTVVSQNSLPLGNSVSPSKAKFLPAQNESHKRLSVMSSLETSHSNGKKSLFFSDDYHSKPINSNTYNCESDKTNRTMWSSQIIDNSSIAVPQRTSKPQIVPNTTNKKFWNDRKFNKQTLQPQVYNISGYASHSGNNTEVTNDEQQAYKCSLNNPSSYYYISNVCSKCKSNEQQLHDETGINSQYSFCHHDYIGIGTENSSVCAFHNLQSKNKTRILDHKQPKPINSIRNSKVHIEGSRKYNTEQKSRDWLVDRTSSTTQPSPECSKYQSHEQKLKYLTSLTSRKLLTPIIPHHEKILKVPLPIHNESVRKRAFIPDIRQTQLVRYNKLYCKNDCENNTISLNTVICETCANLRKANTNVQKHINFTQGFRTITQNKKRNILPLDGTNYLSSFIASPRAYMQHLLQLRRQIVVASGHNSLKYTSQTTENFKS